MIRSASVLLYVYATLAFASGQWEINLSVMRSSSSVNTLRFLCESSDGRPIVNPIFFRDGNVLFISDPMSFVIDQSLEGIYTCGTEDEFGVTTSAPQTLIGE